MIYGLLLKVVRFFPRVYLRVLWKINLERYGSSVIQLESINNHHSWTVITKEMWDSLHLNHEGTTEAKKTMMNTLTHEYELFIIKPGENIMDMEICLIHIVKHMRTLGKVFQIEDLVIKLIRCLNRSLKSL